MAAFLSFFAASAVGTLLWLVLWAARPVTQRFFSQTWHYYAGLIPVFFLLGLSMPVNYVIRLAGADLLNSNTSMGAEAAAEPYLLEIAAERPVGRAVILNEFAADVIEKLDFAAAVPYALLIWAAGMIIFFSFKIKSYYAFKRKILKLSIAFEAPESPVRVVKSGNTAIPMLTGIWKPVIVLPDADIPKNELDIILAHELIHFRRGDLLVKLILLIANGIHWFNPVAYALNRDMDILCEGSCDEKLVSGLDRDGRRFYGEIILSMLERGVARKDGLYTGICNSKENVKRRLLHMMNYKRAGLSAGALSIAAAIAVAGFGGTAAYAMSNAVPGSEIVSGTPWYENFKGGLAAEKVFVNGESIGDFPAFYTRSVEFGGVFEENIMLPLRAVSEKLGLEVTWDAETRTASVSGVSVKELDRPEGYVGTAPYIIGGYFYVSPAFFTQLLNKELNLTYNGVTTHFFGQDLGMTFEGTDKWEDFLPEAR